MTCPLCGQPHLSASVHSYEELRAWEIQHPIERENSGHGVAAEDATPMGDTDCYAVIRYWRGAWYTAAAGTERIIAAERARIFAALPAALEATHKQNEVPYSEWAAALVAALEKELEKG